MFGVALIVLLALLAGPAEAQSCAPKVALERAIQNYGEQQVGYGVDYKSQSYVTIYASSSGSWTFLMTIKGQPKIICVVGTGNKFQHNPGGIVGFLEDGSMFNLTYRADGEWSLKYLDLKTMNWKSLSSGNSWEVLIAPGSLVGA